MTLIYQHHLPARESASWLSAHCRLGCTRVGSRRTKTRSFGLSRPSISKGPRCLTKSSSDWVMASSSRKASSAVCPSLSASSSAGSSGERGGVEELPPGARRRGGCLAPMRTSATPRRSTNR